MKLLIITQSIDKNNTILGFFHRWVVEFAKQFESITVICLEKGECDLPPNVKVLSLGKELKDKNQITIGAIERARSKIRYVLTFWKYVWNERENYDMVFVHMNQEYVLLGAMVWKIFNKKITMWRNHHAGNLFTDVACILCNKIFCTSRFSYTTKFKNTVLMPVGIDIENFKVDREIFRVKSSILFLGRIAPVKKLDLFIEALKNLSERNISFTASIYGDALPKDKDYYDSLVEKVKSSNLESIVTFYKGVPNTSTVSVYNKHCIFVNLSSSGMLDKTIFEAMACGCIVLASNDNLKGKIDNMFIIDDFDSNNLSKKILNALGLSDMDKQEFLKINNQLALAESLGSLANNLFVEMSSIK